MLEQHCPYTAFPPRIPRIGDVELVMCTLPAEPYVFRMARPKHGQHDRNGQYRNGDMRPFHHGEHPVQCR